MVLSKSDDFVFENSGVAMCVFGDDHVISKCNSFFEKLSGYSKKEIEGVLHWYDFVPENDLKCMMEYHKQRSEERDSLPAQYDCSFISKDGSLKFVHITFNINLDSKVRIVSLIDVTDRKKFHDKLEKSERDYRAYIDNAPFGVFIVDKEGNFVEVNDKASKITGYSKDELLTKNVLNIHVEDDQDQALSNFELLKENGSFSCENFFVHKSGSVRCWKINGVKLSNERFMGFTYDITENRNAESKEASFMQGITDVVFQTDKDLVITKVNDAFVKKMGYSREEVVGKMTITGETYAENKKGEKIPIRANCNALLDSKGEPVGGFELVQDLTESKKAQEKLVESNKRLELALKGGELGTWDWNIETNEVDFDTRWVEMKGYKLDELKPHISTWESLVHPDDLPEAKKRLQNHLNGKTSFYEATFRMRNSSGEWIWVLDKGKVIEWDSKGNPVRACGTHLDITKLKKTEEKLKESRSHFETLFNSLKDGVFVHPVSSDNQPGNFERVNESASRMLGYSAEEFNKMSPWDLDDPETCDDYIPKAMDDLKKNGEAVFEAIQITKDGRKLPVEVNTRVIQFKGKPHIISVTRDISERKKAEIKLKKTHEKLKDLNQNLEDKVKERTDEIQSLLRQKDVFINQLGHDLKTPLTPLVTLLPVLKSKVDDNKAKELIETLEQNTEYMRGLVEKTIQLALINSPNTKLDFKKKNLKNLIEKNVEKNRIYFKENKVYLDNGINNDIDVEVDSFHFEELIDNLFTNAVKYSGSKKPKIVVEAESDKDKVVVSIKDNGVGMTEDQIKNIFDEFYKADSSRHDFKSSGLGMTIAKRIVEKHGGKIWAESPGPGKGSTFYFTLSKTNREKEDR